MPTAYRFEFPRHPHGWVWVLRASNGRDIAISPIGYGDRQKAVAASRRVRLAVAAAPPDGEGRPKADAAR